MGFGIIRDMKVKKAVSTFEISDVHSLEDKTFKRWWDKYGKVHREVEAARERRLANAANRRSRRRVGKEFSPEQVHKWRRNGSPLIGGLRGLELLSLAIASDADFYTCANYVFHENSRNVAKLKAAVRRPYYYAAERERRQSLAEARRRINRRATYNACPTKEQILDAWIVRRRSHEDAIRFGSLIEDLECYIDNALIRTEDGVIVGRNPGIKGWLKENIPILATRYTTVMRYKAAAKKLKQITGLRDPIPMDAVLPKSKGSDENKIMARTKSSEKTDGAPSVEIVRARAIWEEVVGVTRRSATALFERIDALLDPLRVEDANMLAEWRGKYENEITERTKRVWWGKRLWKRSG